MPLVNHLNSSSEEDEEYVPLDNHSTEIVDEGQDKMTLYFQTQLRKELRQAVINVDVATLSNYIESMQGTLKGIINDKDKGHQGNTLMHQAILQLDKINGLRPESGLRSKVYSKKLDMLKIVTMLASDKAGAEINI